MGLEQNPTEQWDRYSIEAEIKRRGKSVTQLAKDYGMSDRTVRNALYHPSKRARLLSLTFWENLCTSYFQTVGRLITNVYTHVTATRNVLYENALQHC